LTTAAARDWSGLLGKAALVLMVVVALLVIRIP